MRGRMDKLTAAAFRLSRSQAKEALRGGRVTLDGEIVRDPSLIVEGEGLALCLDGEGASPEEHFYVMMYKPQGVLSATRDGKQQTALDLLPAWYQRGGIVGRLDKDAEGLLLITDDGEANHRLTSPKWHMPKEYRVCVDRPVTVEMAEAFARGIDLGDFITLPAALAFDGDNPCCCTVTIAEGKFHQIKRMFASQGAQVTFLKRLSIGPLTLDRALEPGGYRELEKSEINGILTQIGIVTKKNK